MNPLQVKWDAIYDQEPQQFQASRVLSEHGCLLPSRGKALDLACGLGGNALLMAEAGLNVDAWDISPIALKALQEQARQRYLRVDTKQCDICAELLPIEHYDVIVISRFLDRAVCNAIMACLKLGGLLFYQTYTRDKLIEQGPSNPDYLLASNELLQLFTPLRLIFYQEYARIGDLHYGDRNEACLIGQKPIPE